jgi:hypothetical protein
MITAETITNEQIHNLHAAGAIRAITAARALGIGYPTHADRAPSPEMRLAARIFCAAVANVRAEAHTTEIEREVRGQPFGNSELHLYHRWTCSCGAVGPWGHSLWAAGSIRSAEMSARSHVDEAEYRAARAEGR